ncbi:MAG: hypothetical protein U0930_07800 [Pirellulales bacterium]
MNQLFVTDLQKRYETGLVTSQQYVDEINKVLDSQLEEADALNAISDMFQPNWPIIDALRFVQDSCVPMGILSNTCEAHWHWLMKQTAWKMLHGWFDKIMLSYEVRSMKPDHGIYEACEKACGQSGEQIFFTDDRADNIQAASDRNWITHQYHAPQNDKLLAALDRFLDD